MICIYDKSASDFSTLGLGALEPTECTVNETAGGKFECELTHPIDEADKWYYIQPGNILKVPCAMRETPLIQIKATEHAGGASTIQRSVYSVRTNTGARLMLRTGPSTGYAIIGRYYPGTEVKALESSGNWLRVVVLGDGAEGWMSSTYLVYVRTVTDQVPQTGATAEVVDQTIQPRQTRDQLFRIVSVERNSEDMTVTAKANHIFYDLIGNIVNMEYEPEEASVTTAWNTIVGNLSDSHRFSFFNAITEGTISGNYTGKSVIESICGKDEGFVAQTGARLIRDNFDIMVIPDEVRDRGVQIRHGKNLNGATMTTDYSDIVTKIKPIGTNSEGERLTIDAVFVESDHIDDYPITYTKEIKYDVRVTDSDPDGVKTFATEAEAKAKLTELAQADFEEGIDLPAVEMNVDFVALQNAAEYKQYESLLALFLYDSVDVIASEAGINAKLRVTGYEFDCIDKRYTKITLGEIEDITETAYGYTLPDGSVSGTKIAAGGVDSLQLRNASVTLAKVETATVNQLSAKSITALEAKINALTAGTIETDTLSAAVAHMVNLIADKVSAGTITTGTITAAMAELEVLICGTATFDAATVRHLVSEALNVTNTVSGDAFISNLRVAYAQMVSATIGDLCIKASDGNYYLIDVNSNGTVTATQTTVTAQEIAQGHTNAGDVIVASDITAASLSTSDIFATYALVNKIDAARIDVDQLYAREAFIDRLNTTDIRSNSYIQMMVGEAQREASQWRVIVTSTDADCVLIGTGSTTLSARVYYGAEDMTDSISASMFSWVRSSGNATADATWNTNHSGMKSVTVTAGEASYNAVYSCNVDNGGITAVLGTGTLGTMMLGIGA